MMDPNGYVMRQLEAALKQHELSDSYESRDALFDLLVAAYEDELSDAFRRAGRSVAERLEGSDGDG